ncbi:MAG: hypothetical protein PHC61_03695 [Chitinivibrionales bacterium]|nr:hypothetical protein [Chitinivibrionales bacterium]
MCTMNDSLLELVRKKTVAPEEAMNKALDKGGLMTMFTKNGIALPH